ncbi:MAG TPA: hypothetical protein VF310_06145 [Vicinamibacteria bacterium]
MRYLSLVALTLLTVACGEDTMGPSQPASSRMDITAVSPAAGSVVVIPPSFPVFDLGGVVLPAQSGFVSVGLSMTSASAVPHAQLNVYLLTDEPGVGYCGQNLPDSPTWGALPSGWTTTFTVTGFQVYRLPCRVTGIRAMLHTRTGGALTPPRPDETIAEATSTVRFELRR